MNHECEGIDCGEAIYVFSGIILLLLIVNNGIIGI